MNAVGRRDVSPGLVLAATISAAVLVVANVSSLNVALPQLSRELEASQADVQWMIDVYAVALAALLLPAGALGDRFGRRRMLLFGLAVLAVANAVTVTMDAATPVIVARAASGVGAAFVFPATLSTITATLPSDQRGRGVAMWTAAVSVGGIVGILGSGLLIEAFWWGSVFLAMALASIVVLVVCSLFVPDSSDPAESNLDPLGAVLSFVGVGGLVLGIIEGPVEGWTSPLAAGGLLIGVAALGAFVVWERHTPRPLLDVRLFAEPGVRAGSLSIFVQFSAAFGFFFLTVPYLAFVLGYGPLETGLGLLPIAGGLLPASAIAIPLTRRFGRRIMGLIGLSVIGSSFVAGTVLDVDTGFGSFAVVLVLLGAGLGLSSPPATEAIVEALPAARQGVASALNDVLRELGAAIGIAAIGSAFNAGYRATVNDLVGFPTDVVDVVRESPAAAAVVAPDLGPAGGDLLSGVSAAVVDGWARGMWFGVVLVAVGVVGFARSAPRRQPARVAHRVQPAAHLDLAAIETAGPLGAIEIAAAAEAELGRLRERQRELAETISLLAVRSAVPPDMDTWPASDQTIVAERAALAMAEPLAELGRRCDEVLARTRACDSLVSGAYSELTRIGRPGHPLPELQRRVHEAVVTGHAAAMALGDIAARFDDLAVLRSTLRPAAGRLRAAAQLLAEAYRVSLSWTRSSATGGVPTTDRTDSRRPG